MKPAVLVSLVFALVLPAAVFGQAPADAPTVKSFVVGEGDRVLDSMTARGHDLALHFLLSVRSESNSKLMREFAEKAPTVAGVNHVFVQSATSEEFASMLADAPASLRQSLYRDPDGKLAESLEVGKDCRVNGQMLHCQALILFDATGTEIFRKISKDDADRVQFGAFAAKLGALTKNKETAEGNLSGGLGLQGYDPVSYLAAHKAVLGEKALASTFRGVQYRFATAANREAFNAEPEKYLPAYGGWCATAMAKGDKVEVDPKNFKVTSGRVFLFYKGLLGNAINDWNKDEPGLTTKADASWRRLLTDK